MVLNEVPEASWDVIRGKLKLAQRCLNGQLNVMQSGRELTGRRKGAGNEAQFCLYSQCQKYEVTGLLGSLLGQLLSLTVIVPML